MLTIEIDAAFYALADCRERVPFLRGLFAEGTCQRIALDDLLAAVERADMALAGVSKKPPAPKPT